MKQVNTTYWKVFRVGELFDKLDLKIKKKIFDKTRDVSLFETPEYNLPLVNAKHFNNGIMYYGRECDFESAEMTIDIVANGAASTGDVYPQPQRTGVLIDAYLIKPKKKDFSVYVLYYLATIIQRCIKEKYSYDDKCVWNKVKDEYIYLPAKADEPDWKYMEEYMRRIEQRTQNAISALVASQNKPRKIDTIYWKEFALNGLFDIILSKGDIQAKRMKEGDIPLVSSGKFNNGICAHIAEGDGKAEMFNGNVITTDMFGKSYYQSKPFYAVSHGRVNILIPRFKLCQYIALYLISVLDSSFGSRYSFTGMCSQSQLKQEKILLPATPAGEPDWRYMEMYMRGVEAIVKNKLSLLVPHRPEVALNNAANVTFNGANVTYIDNSTNYNVK